MGQSVTASHTGLIFCNHVRSVSHNSTNYLILFSGVLKTGFAVRINYMQNG